MTIKNDQDFINYVFVKMMGINILYNETGSENMFLISLNVISSSC